MRKLMSLSWQFCLLKLNAILFAAFLITLITSAVESHEVVGRNVLAMTPESLGKEIDNFMEKLKELKQNPPKLVKGKHPILCKATRVALEYLEKVRTFLVLLEELTEKMNPHRINYPSLATFDEKFHTECAQSIEDIKKMQDIDRIPHSTSLYYIVVNFLEKKLVFPDIEGNCVIDQQMKELREKIKEFLPSLQLEKLILNYHVHTLTKMSNILDKYTKLYEKKDLLKNAKIVNEFISSITTEEGQGMEQKLKNREEKMAAGKLAEKEQELMEKLRTHDVMNGATGSLVTFLLKIIRNILAGNGKNPKSLETTWILAEGIVIPAFDQFTESSKTVNGPKVTTYLKENLSLPKDWIEREMVIFQNKLYASEARQQAQALMRYHTGLVLLTYVTLTQKSLLLKEFEPTLDERQKTHEEIGKSEKPKGVKNKPMESIGTFKKFFQKTGKSITKFVSRF